MLRIPEVYMASKGYQINPQKKNPLPPVKDKDVISGSENLGAHRVLDTMGALLRVSFHFHASPASPGHCWRLDAQPNDPLA